MNRRKLTSLARKVLSTPTAPFHEYHVREKLTELLSPLSHVSLRVDDFGNLLATYKRGNKRPRWVLGSHMDHPGWVRRAEQTPESEDDYEFLGGVPKRYLKKKSNLEARKPYGEFAMWDVVPFAHEKDTDLLHGRACDDLAGCTAIVAAFIELEESAVEATVHAAFTRAEEVGFIGAIHLAKNWPFGKSPTFLSLETSAPAGGAKMGKGPIVRVGDRMTTFDNESTSRLLATAKEHEIPHQRCLLDKGACEATALAAYGIPSSGISLPLGNYHNCGTRSTIAPEHVSLSDLSALVDLLTADIQSTSTPSPASKLRGRLDKLFAENQKHDRQAQSAWKKHKKD